MTIVSPYLWQTPMVDAAVRSLEKDKFFILATPTGSGKTVVSLAAAKRLGWPHLVVAPKVSLTQWHRVAEAMGASSNLISVINPERISSPRGCEFYTREGKWRLPPGCLVTWDEPHRSCSGPKSHSTLALAELKAYARGLMAMSATVADSPLKLRSLGWWNGSHMYNDQSFYRWCRKHGCRDVDLGWGRGAAGRSAFKFTTSKRDAVKHMADIRQEFGTRFLSLKASDIPGFPSETISIKYLDLSKRDQDEINTAYEEMSERMKSIAQSSLSELGRMREQIEFVMALPLAELAANHIEDGNSTVTFFSFTEPRLRYEAKLRELGVGDIASVFGGQKDEARQAGVDAFQRNEIHAASIMIKAGGACLSLHDLLHERPRVSFLTPTYESDLFKQALGRIRRCEGTHATQYIVIAAATLQEKVAASLERKLGNIASLNESDLLP